MGINNKMNDKIKYALHEVSPWGRFRGAFGSGHKESGEGVAIMNNEREKSHSDVVMVE